MKKNNSKIFIFSSLIFGGMLLSLFFAQTVSAQVQNLDNYCQQAAQLSPPADGDNTTFTEPNYQQIKTTDNLTGTYRTRSSSGPVTINSANLPFAKGLADYLEGPFQEESHRTADLRTIRQPQFAFYNGPAVELLPQRALDSLRLNYVTAVMSEIDASNSTTLQEASFEYTDVCGQNRRTIKELVDSWGMPAPASLGGSLTSWQQTWQRYWPKIPTTINPLTQGCIKFSGPTNSCPTHTTSDAINIGTPDTFRLNNLATIIQQLLVPQQLITGTFAIPEPRDGPTGLGSRITFYDSSDNPTTSANASPTTSEAVAVLPFVGSIWTKLIGANPSGSFAGALPSLVTRQDLKPEIIEIDAKLDVSSPEDLPLFARFLGGVENLRGIIVNSLKPRGAR